MTTHRCCIGITCDFQAHVDRRGTPASYYSLPEAYVRAVTAAEAVAVILPHGPVDRISELLEKVDALVISGGDFDVPPSYYGAQPSAHLGRLAEERSAFERALLQQALARDIPLLGVCGGMQLLNVVMGGSLYQDLSEHPHALAHEQPYDKRCPSHAVEITPHTWLHRLLETSHLNVNSTHHQGVKVLGKGVVASAAAPDGVVEALEIPAHRFALGVQWHPELLEDPLHMRLYEALVASAQERSGK